MAAVAITEADGWAVGETLEDLIEYATQQGAAGYDVHEVRVCTCAGCGGQVFSLHSDLEQQAAKRVCAACGAGHFIADSDEYFDDRTSAVTVCACEDETGEEREACHLAVGFSLYPNGAGIRALAITTLCVSCGRLGYWDDWMIRGGEMRLLERA
jgi:hypothetical protein